MVLAAAKVGGILANNTYPVDFLSENLQIQVNVMDAALEHGVERLLFLGSSCIYPKLAPQPIKEESLLTGHLEPTNDAYAIAKIAGILQVQAVRRQYGLAVDLGDADEPLRPGRQLLADRLARPSRADPPVRRGGRRAAPARSRTGGPAHHVVSSSTSTTWPTPACTCWSTTTVPSRSTSAPAGTPPSRRSPRSIADVVGYKGETLWDTSKPDGTPQKLLDVGKLAEAGWTAKIGLREGLESTVAWYRDHVDDLREK